MKPNWTKFLSAYPDYVTYPDSAKVKELIGGKVNAAWIHNTCAIRLSRGLNYSGLPVTAHFAGLSTVAGGDRKQYAFRVAEVRKWLPHALGKPEFDLTKKSGEAFDKTRIAGIKGIIAFDIKFADATGHLDSWDGLHFSREDLSADYWTLATRITVWKLPDSPAEAAQGSHRLTAPI